MKKKKRFLKFYRVARSMSEISPYFHTSTRYVDYRNRECKFGKILINDIQDGVWFDAFGDFRNLVRGFKKICD